MGAVQQTTGFINDPFFNRTLYPLENTGGIASLARTNGAGNAVTSAPPADLQQYQYLALNNEGENARYVYGVSPDGSETLVGIYNIPFTRVGIQVIGETRVDNPNQFILQSADNDRLLIFSNSTLPAGSNVTFTPAQGDYAVVTCYVTGTLIRTTRGEVAVEHLRVGDLAVTGSGEHRPIRWIGHRTMDPRRHRRPQDAQPVRIHAGAFGDGKPARDLLVSPGHSIAVDILGEVLIPAGALVNGVTIVQEEVETVTYWHVELDSHDLLVAEGLAAESYLDMGNRGFFTDGAVVALAAGPDADSARRSYADFCRPYHDSGALVDVVRAQIRRRIEAQGWSLDLPTPFEGAHLLIDGEVVRPEIRGMSACFALPAEARDVWLTSPTGAPREVGDNPDGRALGLCLSGMRFIDGFGETRAIGLDNPSLCVGFHRAEPDHRWTAGRARLPADLWSGLTGMLLLRLDLSDPSMPKWIAPAASLSLIDRQAA